MNKKIKDLFLAVLLIFTVVLFGKIMVSATETTTEGKITVNKTATKEIGEVDNETYGRKANVTLSVAGNEFTTSSSLDVVLVLDRSSSMHNNNSSKLADAKAAAVELVNELFKNNTNDRKVVQMGVVTFGKTIIDKWSNNSLTSTKSEVINKINAITSNDSDIPGNINGQGTNVQSGLAKANELLKNSTAKNKVVILLTDGEPTLFDYPGFEEPLGNGSSDEEVCVEYSKTETERVCYPFGGCSNQPKCITKKKPSDMAKVEATTLKGNNVTIYSVGFGIKDSIYDSENTKNSKKNARQFLQSVATKTIAPYYLLAENKSELTNSFNDIINSITTIAKNVVVTDTVPQGFTVDETALKNTYGDKVSIAPGENNTTIITWNIGELTVTENPTLTYQVIAKADYYGGMYTNVTAILTGDATEGNPAYPTGKIEEVFPLPEVAIPMITEDDNYSAKLGEVLNINKTNGILKNDSSTQLTDGENTTVVDKIIIKNTSCGNIKDIKVNEDGSFTYTPNSSCYGQNNNKVVFEYEVKSIVTINGIKNTVISNTSNITIDLTKDNSSLEEPTVTKINDNGNTTTSITEPFNYTIDYQTTIQNHVGSTTITIVDTLPYEIDTTKSNIDGGIYNQTNKTITWTETINNINSYKNENNDIHIIKHISVIYKNISTDIDSIINKVTVSTDITNKPVETEQKTEVIKGTLVVEYKDNLGNTLLPNETSTGLINTTYQTTADDKITKDNIEYQLVATKVNNQNIEKTNNYSNSYKEETTTVTYIYYKVTGKIDEEQTTITKKGPEKVTSSTEEFDYKITYNTKIENYIGNATVTIIDTLPYEIDTTKSNLEGGIYNQTTKTITWIIPYENINTYEAGSYPIEVIKNIKVVFKNLNPTDRTLTNTVTGKVETTKSTNEKTTEEETILEIKGKVIAHYVDTNNQTISNDEITTDLVGNDYITSEKDIKDYLLVSTIGNETGKYIEGTIEVTYVYYKQVGTIKEETINKTGTNKVTSTTDPFQYEITYNTKIENYIGNATVTIIDTLPYEIDTTKSNLDGGIYDKETLTITWNIPYENINTNESGTKLINITKNIEVVYIGIEPTTREVINSVVATLETELSKSTTDPANKTTIVEVKGTVTANYITTTNEVLTDEITTSDLVGNEYITEELTFEGYELVEVKGNKIGTYTTEPIEVTYIYYQETGEITNNEVIKTGTEIITKKEQPFNYTINYKTEINNYIGNAIITIVDKLPLAIDLTSSDLNGGIYDEESLTITWIITVENINTYKDGSKIIEFNKDIILVYKDLNPIVEKVINNVTSSIKTDISEEETKDEATTLVDIKGIVKVNYIDDLGNNLTDSITLTGKVGYEYATEEKEFDNYELILIKGEEYGEYQEEEQTVTYIYTKLGKGGDVEVLPPQTGVETTTTISFNLFTIICASFLFLVKKFI